MNHDFESPQQLLAPWPCHPTPGAAPWPWWPHCRRWYPAAVKPAPAGSRPPTNGLGAQGPKAKAGAAGVDSWFLNCAGWWLNQWLVNITCGWSISLNPRLLVTSSESIKLPNAEDRCAQLGIARGQGPEWLAIAFPNGVRYIVCNGYAGL